MNSHKVSIIIPSFNRENLIRETLDSVISQTYQNWECIIVDDGSTDNTIKVVSEYVKRDHRFQIFQRNRTPKGANICRNIGAEKSDGQFLIFLDSDDILLEHCLENRLSIYCKLSDKDFLIFPKAYFSKDQETLEFKLPPKNELIKKFLLLQPPWQTTSLIIKNTFFFDTNGFDEKLDRFQDIDLFLRLINRSLDSKFEQINECKFDYIRRIGHYNKREFIFSMKTSNSLWLLIKKHLSLSRVKIEYKKAILIAFKILIFDYLTSQNKLNRAPIFSKFLTQNGVLSPFQNIIIKIYVIFSKTVFFRMKGFRHLFRNVLLN